MGSDIMLQFLWADIMYQSKTSNHTRKPVESSLYLVAVTYLSWYWSDPATIGKKKSSKTTNANKHYLIYDGGGKTINSSLENLIDLINKTTQIWILDQEAIENQRKWKDWQDQRTRSDVRRCQ